MTTLMSEEDSWVSLQILWMDHEVGPLCGVKASLPDFDDEHETNSFLQAHKGRVTCIRDADLKSPRNKSHRICNKGSRDFAVLLEGPSHANPPRDLT